MRMFPSRQNFTAPRPPAPQGQATHPTLCQTSSGFFKGVVWTALALCAGAASAQTPTRFADDMAERTRACTACHGEQGRAGPDG